ncbi:rho guanine nucleotide exchange factor 28 isoform X2 [Sphaerodactylus townsendi]|uniref:rho guanine nucleotide exchange factor 28 isoform X2 n=1 Tax=Sphaerodactylus townsendi TaxID=933632 RepID=UPI0020261992|nr:rho guanine nucleotide exchange factor 28 isoform X2 [Sphaerodactylus townsendi]
MTDAVTMELSCTEVPLYGQLTVYGKFYIVLLEDAEFYFVYNGSNQRHVVFAKRIGDDTLQSTIPAHGEQEDVSVCVVMYTKEGVSETLGYSSVTYKWNTASEVAHFLMDQAGCLTSSSHDTLLSMFGLMAEDFQSLDRDIMLAMAHKEISPTWNITGTCSQDESKHKETLLHLAMRLGLVKLSQFLLSLPGGTDAVTLPNEDGSTPLDLALQNGHASLVEIIKAQVSHPFEISQVELGENAVLQFVHSSRSLMLTFNRTANHSLESDIQIFRRYLWDRAFLHKSLIPEQTETLGELQMPCDSTCSAEDPMDLVSVEPSLINEDVTFYRDPSVENENDSLLDLDHQPSPFHAFKKCPSPSTFFAAARLSAMLNGSDEVYANRMVVNQIEEAGINYTHGGQSTLEPCTDQAESNEDPEAPSNSSRNTSPVIPSNLCTAGSYLPLKAHGFSHPRNQRYSIMKKRSSSLDDLDVEGVDERSSNRPHHCYRLMPFSSSGALANKNDEFNSVEQGMDLDFNRAESLPLSTNLQPKEPLLSGIRSRSYSYTSPKVNLGKSHGSCDFTICDSNDEQCAYSLTEQSREKRIQEEDWDKYIIPTKSESEKYKVSRTFSFLMNRMASTRNKSKAKNKDSKEREKPFRHQFVSGTFAGVIPCFACEKPLLGKESLQCSYCNASVHKNCKDCAPACTKKSQERCHLKNRTQTIQTNLSFRDIPQPSLSPVHFCSSTPIGLSFVKKDALLQQHSLSKSVPSSNLERKCSSPLEPDIDPWRSRSHSEELLQSIGSASSVESVLMEDDVDASLWNDLSTDTLDYEGESWSLVVDAWFCSKQEKEVIKRQDVIFELMQTEVHHIHTLFIMSKIFRKGMKEELQLDHSTVDKIFPCLDELLELHQQFFCSMKERRQESSQGGSDRNFVISRIGDLLVQQFSEENATKMKKIYGEFCSHQKEAVSLFKELQQNKKFQNFIKLRSSNLLARRRGIPECILLVTQRITKYPVLVERILQYSKEGTEEHQDLCKALGLIKDMIAAVDLQVNEYEKKQKLLEILSKVENKTYTKLKTGHVFRKQDLIKKEKTLLHEGLVYWKTATGRFKDILALLLNDVMLFLQEKDQKYIFAAVDQKPAVIALQKLIVREVANEERGMFLISASSPGPEMYEIHTSSKEERSHWMRQIQEAVENCPEEEGKMNESDEDRRVAEARIAKIQKCQATLSNKDQQICSCLEDKLAIYSKLGNMSGFEDVHVEPHLLIKPDSGETPQVASLLAAALKEVENLHGTVASTQTKDPIQSTDESTRESSPTEDLSAVDVCESMTDLTEIKGDELCDADADDTNTTAEVDVLDQEGDTSFPTSAQIEIVQTIQNLTRLLYSIQAALAIQDSHVGIHKLVLQEHERFSWSPSSRSTSTPEQEKHRNFKQKEELANVHKVQHQFQQEQQRWHRECEQWHQEHQTRESQLLEREKECLSQEELLCRNREELNSQLQDYQQNLERLRESQRMVEKEREMVKLQHKILHHWKHSRQSSLPGVISPGDNEIMGHNRSDSFCGENSVFINEALLQMSLNHLNKSNSNLVYQNYVHGVNQPNSSLSRTSENQTNCNMDSSCQQTFTEELSKSADLCHHTATPCKSNTDSCNNRSCTEDLNSQKNSANEDCIGHPRNNSDQTHKSQTAKFQGLNAVLSQCPRSSSHDSVQPLQPSDIVKKNLSCDMQQDSENAGIEENIVYL